MIDRRMRIAVDARYLSHGLVGGVHTYVHNLIEAMLACGAPYDFDLWVDDKASHELGPLPTGTRVRTLGWKSLLSSIRNDLRIGKMMQHAGADLAHFPANYGFAPAALPAIITLHDAINILPLPEIIGGHEKRPRTMLTMTYLHLVTSRAIHRQPFVVTVSQHARREILRHSRLKPEQVRAVYSAADRAFRVLEPDVVGEERNRLGLRQNVILADGIKNPGTTIDAYRKLSPSLRKQTSLVFFSRREPPEAVHAAARAGECRIVLRPCREKLVMLFNIADLFIFPSPYEGFGLPALEAMACGTPVIGSGAGSIPEIVSDEAGVIVDDPDDYHGFCQAIEGLLADSDRLNNIHVAARQRASEFSWKRTAEATLEAYVAAIEWSQSQAAATRLRSPART